MEINKMTMCEHVVKPSPQYLLRLKCDVIRENARWQEAERGSEAEAEAEERLSNAVIELLNWCPEYDNNGWGILELDYHLKKEIGWGKEIKADYEEE